MSFSPRDFIGYRRVMGEKGSVPRLAVVTFASARAAGRRIAGVAAAARIVRELAEAGVAEARLVLPGGEALDPAAMADVRRLAGPLDVRVVAGDAAAAPAEGRGQDVLYLAGSRLVPAELIPHLHSGEPHALGAGIVPLDARRASGQILARTGKAGDGPVSRWLNRPASRCLSALLLRLPWFRPIHATAGTALLALLMFAALVWGGAEGVIAGGLLFQAASLFDGVDGEVARATFRASPAGAVLDSVVDVATNTLLVAGLTYNLALRGDGEAPLLAGWGFMLFVLGLAVIAWRTSRRPGPFSLDLVKHHYRRRFSGRLVPWLIEAATVVTSRDFFALLFAVLMVGGFPIGCLYLFAAAATVWILFVMGSFGVVPNAALASRGA